MATRPIVLSLTADLAAGRITSRALVEAALARITDPSGEGARTRISENNRVAAAWARHPAVTVPAPGAFRKAWRAISGELP